MAILQYDFQDLYEAVARVIHNDSSAGGDDSALAECKAIANRGLLNFYYCHKWGFLSPNASISLFPALAVSAETVSASGTTVTATAASFYPEMIGGTLTVTDIGTRTITGYTSTTVITVDSNFAGSHTFSMDPAGDYRLPDDFGSLVDRFNWPKDSGYSPLKDVSPESLRALRSAGDSGLSDPTHYAYAPVACDASVGQRWTLMVYPEASTLRVMQYRYSRNPVELSADSDLPWGGPALAPCIMAAVLAQAEMEKLKTYGPYNQTYALRNGNGNLIGGMLFSAIQQDNANRPSNLGPNLDHSDDIWRQRPSEEASTWTYPSGPTTP